MSDDNLLDDMNKNIMNLHKVLINLNTMSAILAKELEKLTVRVTKLEGHVEFILTDPKGIYKDE